MEDEINKELDLIFGNSNEDYESFYDYNREDKNAIYIDEKENAIDSIETALQFLSRNDNLKWKWFAFALHYSLYSFCIRALECGNYENVLSRKGNDNKEIYVQFGNHLMLT